MRKLLSQIGRTARRIAGGALVAGFGLLSVVLTLSYCLGEIAIGILGLLVLWAILRTSCQ